MELMEQSCCCVSAMKNLIRLKTTVLRPSITEMNAYVYRHLRALPVEKNGGGYRVRQTAEALAKNRWCSIAWVTVAVICG